VVAFVQIDFLYALCTVYSKIMSMSMYIGLLELPFLFRVISIDLLLFVVPSLHLPN
jgi:hypothetical protein